MFTLNELKQPAAGEIFLKFTPENVQIPKISSPSQISTETVFLDMPPDRINLFGLEGALLDDSSGIPHSRQNISRNIRLILVSFTKFTLTDSPTVCSPGPGGPIYCAFQSM